MSESANVDIIPRDTQSFLKWAIKATEPTPVTPELLSTDEGKIRLAVDHSIHNFLKDQLLTLESEIVEKK